MLDVLVGLLALVIGAVFCFAGQSAMRIIFPFWGFFVGFVGGAGMVTAITNESFFGTLMSWFVGFAVGILFAVCSYLFYAVAVTLAITSLGFAVTTGLLAAIGIDWNWLVVALGVVAALLVAGWAIRFGAPSLVLIVATALVGGYAMTKGLMVVFNVVDLENFSDGSSLQIVRDNWLWFVAWLSVSVFGGVAQYKVYRIQAQTMRELWDKSMYPEDMFGKLAEPK